MDYCCTDQEFQGGSNHEFIRINVPDFSLSKGGGFPRGIGRECAVTHNVHDIASCADITESEKILAT